MQLLRKLQQNGNYKLITMTVYRNLTICLSVLLVISCTTSNKKSQDVENKEPLSIATLDEVPLQIDSVLTINTIVNDDNQCSEWNVPSSNDIIRIAQLMKGTSGNNWHNCYGDWSCSIEGELLKDNVRYYYRLDAGGWIILQYDDESQYYGCATNEDCWKFFPSSYLCDKDGVLLDKE